MKSSADTAIENMSIGQLCDIADETNPYAYYILCEEEDVRGEGELRKRLIAIITGTKGA